ncbi:MAG: TraB/GumN family protein [Kofleriaceae bacterium]
MTPRVPLWIGWWAALAVISVWLAGCAGAPQCPLAPRTPSGAPFLWRVQKAPGGPVVWLYGTFHNGHAQVPPSARRALERATHFVSELGDTDPHPDRLRELARIDRGKGLDQRLPFDDWYDLRDALRGVVKEDELKRARPWFAMSQLTRTMAPSPRPTMDVALAERARARGIAVEALETWDEQLVALDAAVQIPDLAQAIHARKDMRCSVERILGAYAAGDLEAMQRLLGVAQSETLLAARNRLWLPKLERHFAEGETFVAVGVSHLAGESGLPAMFARAGYVVERASP